MKAWEEQGSAAAGPVQSEILDRTTPRETPVSTRSGEACRLLRDHARRLQQSRRLLAQRPSRPRSSRTHVHRTSRAGARRGHCGESQQRRAHQAGGLGRGESTDGDHQGVPRDGSTPARQHDDGDARTRAEQQPMLTRPRPPSRPGTGSAPADSSRLSSKTCGRSWRPPWATTDTAMTGQGSPACSARQRLTTE